VARNLMVKYYVDVEDSYSISVYKTDDVTWWRLGGWCTPHGDEVLFTPCDEPSGKLVKLENVFTGNEDFQSGKVTHKEE